MFGKYYVLSGATPCCLSKATLSMPNFHCCSCHGHWEMHAQSRPNLILLIFNRIVDFAIPVLQSGRLHQLSRAMMQISVAECVCPQQHTGERPVFVHCIVLKIAVFFLITSTIASCLVEVSYLVKTLGTTALSCVLLRTCIFHWYLHHSPRKLLEVSTLKTLQNPLSGEIHHLW